MIIHALLITAFALVAQDPIQGPIIRQVQVKGNSRVPEASILSLVSAVPNESLNRTNFREDVNKLHNLGRFENIEVHRKYVGQGKVDITYQVSEFPFISSFGIEGVDGSVEDRIHDYLREKNLELHAAMPFSPSIGKKVAGAIRHLLRSLKYPNASVQITATKRGDSVRVLARIETGPRLEVGAVHFRGNHAVSRDTLLGRMQHTRPSAFWIPWRGGGRLVPEDLNSDLQQVRLYYLARGFAAVSVGEPCVRATEVNGKQRLEIEIPIEEGAHYRLNSLGIEGNAKAAASDVKHLVSAIELPRAYDYVFLESTRQRIADILGRHGYAMAHVQLKQSLNEAERTVGITYELDSRNPVVIGRIVIRGNKRLPDKFLRRELEIEEGEIFDVSKLDKSLERLNKSNLVHKMQRSDVVLDSNERDSLLNITFHIREKGRQGIYFTGGSGGVGGGSIGVLYNVFNLLRIGETVSLKLDGGASQSNAILNIAGTHFLGTPFSLGLSIFHTTTGFNVANIMPGLDDIIGIFCRSSTGVNFSGAYPLREGLETGLNFEMSKDQITDYHNFTLSPRTAHTAKLTHFVAWDRTSMVGHEMRGYRLEYAQKWNGNSLLKSLSSVGHSARVAFYLQDPLSRGRNSFAIRFKGGDVRPLGSDSVYPEHRLYPGNDIVRGFKPGSLSTYSVVPGVQEMALQATGVETVLGFSAEYRVPIRGALSSVGFFDLGWSRMNAETVVPLGTGARLIESTNGIIRGSLGGELRLQMPAIRQPARLIFSWNLLRLKEAFVDSSSVLRLADPQTALSFAFGNPY